MPWKGLIRRQGYLIFSSNTKRGTSPPKEHLQFLLRNSWGDKSSLGTPCWLPCQSRQNSKHGLKSKPKQLRHNNAVTYLHDWDSYLCQDGLTNPNWANPTRVDDYIFLTNDAGIVSEHKSGITTPSRQKQVSGFRTRELHEKFTKHPQWIHIVVL